MLKIGYMVFDFYLKQYHISLSTQFEKNSIYRNRVIWTTPTFVWVLSYLTQITYPLLSVQLICLRSVIAYVLKRNFLNQGWRHFRRLKFDCPK